MKASSPFPFGKASAKCLFKMDPCLKSEHHRRMEGNRNALHTHFLNLPASGLRIQTSQTPWAVTAGMSVSCQVSLFLKSALISQKGDNCSKIEPYVKFTT